MLQYNTPNPTDFESVGTGEPSKVHPRFAIRSIVTHVFTGRRKARRDRWRARRATLNEKSYHWSLPSSRIAKKTLRDNTEMETLPASDIRMPKRFCFYRICPRVPSLRLFSFSLFELPFISSPRFLHISSNQRMFFFLVVFSDYRIVLPRRFLSSLEKTYIANFVNSTVNRDKRNCVSLR